MSIAKGAGSRKRNSYHAGLLTALIVIWLLTAAGCGDSGVDATIAGFLTAARDKDCDRMVDYLDPGSQENQGGAISKAEMVNACNASGGLGNVVNYRITGEKVEGDTAVVGVELTMNDGGQEQARSGSFNLVRKDDLWKLTTPAL